MDLKPSQAALQPQGRPHILPRKPTFKTVSPGSCWLQMTENPTRNRLQQKGEVLCIRPSYGKSGEEHRHGQDSAMSPGTRFLFLGPRSPSVGSRLQAMVRWPCGQTRHAVRPLRSSVRRAGQLEVRKGTGLTESSVEAEGTMAGPLCRQRRGERDSRVTRSLRSNCGSECRCQTD